MTTWNACTDPAIGLDVSHWQGKIIPWAEARDAGVRWAVAKAFHGRGVVGGHLEQLEGARVAGVEPIGRYAWMLPDSDLDMQIGAWCATAIGRGELPLTIDFEEPGTAARGRALIARLEHVIERVSDRIGQRPIIYTGAWYWTGYCQGLDSQLVAECPLWLAAYPRKAATGTRYREAVAEVCGGVMPAIPRPWADRKIEPVMWQFDGDHGLTLPGGVAGVHDGRPGRGRPAGTGRPARLGVRLTDAVRRERRLARPGQRPVRPPRLVDGEGSRSQGGAGVTDP
jgi:hypothetical protein